MTIKIVVSDTVGFKVRGHINDAAGVPQAFDFRLVCARLDTDQISAKLKTDDGESIVDFMVSVIEDWSGVRDAEDKPLPYSAAAYRQLCKIPSVGNVAFKTYLAEVGAKEVKEKN